MRPNNTFEANIRHTWDLVYTPGCAVEIRALLKTGARVGGKFSTVASGYFDNYEAFRAGVLDAEKLKPGAVYVTLNPVRHDLTARAYNRLIGTDNKAPTTSDKDIISRRLLLIDADPLRPAGISSTDAELAAANAVRDEVAAYLYNLGFPRLAGGMSGNGAHLLGRIDLPNDEQSTRLIDDFLQCLDWKFGHGRAGAKVGIDTTVYNAARITKLYGTTARKGDSTPTRPHRDSYLCSIPEQMEVISAELLQQVADEYRAHKAKEATPKPKTITKSGTGNWADSVDGVETYLANRGVRLGTTEKYSGDGFQYKWTVDCITSGGAHKDGAALFWGAGKGLGYKCHHDSCRGKGWADVRAIIDPKPIYTNGHYNGFDPGNIEIDIQPAPGKQSYSEILAYLDERAAALPDGYATQCISRNELGCAELLCNIAKGVIAFDRGSLEWHIYNGLHWEVDKGGNIPSITGQALSAVFRNEATAAYRALLELDKEIGAETPTPDQAQRKEQLKSKERSAKGQAKELYKLAYIRNVLTFAGATSLLGVDPDLWDAQPNLLGVANAVIDLTTGKPVDPAPGQYIRTVAPAPYDPNATCPTWERAISEILAGDDKMVGYIKRLLGYAISGLCHESDFFVWYGKDGRNGKEFILECVRAVLGGKLAGVVEPELLLSSKAQRTKNSSTEGLMVLRGRRLAWASETNEGRTLDNAAMKDLSGGHILTGRHNHGRQEEWKRTHTLILLTNHKPHVAGGGGGAEWDRLKLVNFTESFVSVPDPHKPNEHKKDPTLGAKIEATELSGLLNWLIAGCLEWKRGGLDTPEKVAKATKQYREDEDTLGRFINEWCAKDPNATEYAQKLYNAYKDWFISGGEGKPLGRNNFLNKLEERGFSRGDKDMHGMPITGLKITAINLTNALNEMNKS